MTSRSPLDLALRAGPLLLLGLALAFALRDPGALDPPRLAALAAEAGVVGIAALGLVLVLLTAGIDLSVGAVMLLAPLAAGLLLREAGAPPEAALPACLAAGAALGAVNAALVVGLRLPPVLVTLASLVLFGGLAAGLSGARPAALPELGPDPLLGLPLPVPVLLALALAVHVLLRHTAFGRHLQAFGDDPAAARRAGLPVRRIEGAAYVASGTLAALAGFLLAARPDLSAAGLGEGPGFDALAAAVLGGASLLGGLGGAWSAVLGALTLQALRSGLAWGEVDPRLQPVALAAAVLLAVLLDALRRSRLRARRRGAIRPRPA